MILIIGGSYQGKLDFARERYGLTDDDIHFCDETTDALDFSRRCIAYIDRFALNRVRAGAEPADALGTDPGLYKDVIFIANDISGGIVPMDPVLRAWREACGRMNLKLAREANEVWRLFCGIPQRVK
jgi:adenosyl cobinamide kinase/adenosyl cobinamide phosphate guanylyltransferase